MPLWKIHIIGEGRSEDLGKVDAADEREAVTRAIRVFLIPSELHARIAIAPTIEPDLFLVNAALVPDAPEMSDPGRPSNRRAAYGDSQGHPPRSFRSPPDDRRRAPNLSFSRCASLPMQPAGPAPM